MKIVAILAARNEAQYVKRCLQHLADQGIEFVLIDNDSSDNTVGVAAQFKHKGLIDIIHFSYKGFYDWGNILRLKQKLAYEINADWFIHHDADEIRESPYKNLTLAQAIERVDQQGFNAINFDEFVFIPENQDISYEGTDYVEAMQYYYYFSPNSHHRVNAWRKQNKPIDIVSSGGHHVYFENIQICPENFILRHYIGLSKKYLEHKYGNRVFSKEHEIRGWGRRKIRTISEKKVLIPKKSELLKIKKNGSWNRSNPKKDHLIFLPPKTTEVKNIPVKVSPFYIIQLALAPLSYLKKYRFKKIVFLLKILKKIIFINKNH